MPVHIEQIDSEIEILPSVDRDSSTGRGAVAPAQATEPERDRLRRVIARALEEELQEYLRIRG